MISLSPSNDSAVLWFECQPGHFHLVDETPNCRSAAADTKVFQQWTKSEDLQKEKNRSLPASFGGRRGGGDLWIYGRSPQKKSGQGNWNDPFDTHNELLHAVVSGWSLTLERNKNETNCWFNCFVKHDWRSQKNIKWLVDGCRDILQQTEMSRRILARATCLLAFIAVFITFF